jgi:hypothetical protein
VLEHTKLESTVRHLGIEVNALTVADRPTPDYHPSTHSALCESFQVVRDSGRLPRRRFGARTPDHFDKRDR